MPVSTTGKTTGTISSTGLITTWIGKQPSDGKNDTLRVELFGTTGKFTGTVKLMWGLDPGTTNGSTWKPTMNATYTTTTSEIVEVGTSFFSHSLLCTALTSGTIGYVLANK